MEVIGTNCYNCKFVALQEMAVDPKELNDEGGIDPKNKDETERAKSRIHLRNAHLRRVLPILDIPRT